MAKKKTDATQSTMFSPRYDVEMIRDFLDQLCYETSVLAAEMTDPPMNAMDTQLKARAIAAKRGSYLTPLHRFEPEPTDDERKAIRRVLRNRRGDEVDSLLRLLMLFDQALETIENSPEVEGEDPVWFVKVLPTAGFMAGIAASEEPKTESD